MDELPVYTRLFIGQTTFILTSIPTENFEFPTHMHVLGGSRRHSRNMQTTQKSPTTFFAVRRQREPLPQSVAHREPCLNVNSCHCELLTITRHNISQLYLKKKKHLNDSYQQDRTAEMSWQAREKKKTPKHHVCLVGTHGAIKLRFSICQSTVC